MTFNHLVQLNVESLQTMFKEVFLFFMGFLYTFYTYNKRLSLAFKTRKKYSTCAVDKILLNITFLIKDNFLNQFKKNSFLKGNF